ncbi:MAG: RES family NAD+ phosphorylase, partial [Candidatus Sulfotelmatobacter sp.]
NMAEFKSCRSYRQFAHSITTQWRFARNAERADFLHAVLATSVSRQEVIPAESTLWRAQLRQDWIPEDQGGGIIDEFPSPFGPERMKPLVNRAREGRANPKGIPYLYLATHQETAVAEIRPWIGSSVSIAVFRLSREVRVVNAVSDDHRLIVYASEPKPEVREREIWRDIDRAFSQPVTSADNTADYAPTQVLAEFFRESGLDGVAYGSSLGPGHNLALFDIDAATLVKCDLVEICGVKFDFSLAANPYFMSAASKG